MYIAVCTRCDVGWNGISANVEYCRMNAIVLLTRFNYKDTDFLLYDFITLSYIKLYYTLEWLICKTLCTF